jgi:hypothetical protein
VWGKKRSERTILASKRDHQVLEKKPEQKARSCCDEFGMKKYIYRAEPRWAYEAKGELRAKWAFHSTV